MYILLITALMMLPAFTGSVQAYEIMTTPKLHVEGRYLKDPSGKNVLLHGWMQPTETWFNGGGRWYSNPSDWTNPNNVAGMLNYLCDAATVMSDTSPKYGRDHGWYCSFVRVNTDAIGGWTQQDGLVNPTQFDAWIQNFVVPYAAHLRSRGLYLVLSATGPINTPNNGTHNAGIVEQQRLITFWQTVANAPGVKSADNIHFELMNEPVDIESVPGNGDWGNHQNKYFQAFTNWMQPVINAIRGTGADNVIWVPTLEWQGSPYQWALYPFTGTNIGVACHYYPAYGGVFDDPIRVQNLWNSQYKPAADQWPMIITEMFWTPYPDDPWNLVNGHTDGFGNAIKSAMDNQGNVSYLVGFLSDLLYDLNASRPDDCSLSTREGAPAYFDWLPTYTWAAPSDRPRGLTASTLFDSQINLTWTAVPDAISYNIMRATVSGGPYTTLVSDITATGFSDTNLTPGEAYYYIVSANTAEGESVNSNEATAISLHAHLKFDESGGTTAPDAAGNGWTGTLVNGPVWTGEGNFGNAVDLDGSDDHVTLPTGVVDGLTEVTISTWVYLNSTSSWSRIIDFGTGTSVNMFLTPQSNANAVRFAITTGGAGGEQQINGITALPTALWTHVAVTLNGSAGTLYVNGTQVGRNNSMMLTPDSLGSTTQNYIGKSQYPDPYLDGRVDDFRIWPVALSADQVETLYHADVPYVIPAAPGDVMTTTVSSSQIDITWNGAADATNYSIKRSGTSGGPYTVIANAGGTAYSDTGLQEGTAYYYVVSALNSAGSSSDSPEGEGVTLAIPPSAPSGLTAVPGDSEVALNWNANTEGDIAGYNVYRSSTPGDGYVLLNGTLLTSPEYTDETAANFTMYCYVVTAVDLDTLESGYSNEAEAMPNDGTFIPLHSADFESGLGDWVNMSGDDTHDWTRDSGGTLTPGTGPIAGADGSTWYLYLETSPGGAASGGDTAILESPVINGYKRVLNFYYHMYGIEIGTLNVDVYDGAWHEGVWSLSGQQQTSNGEAYRQVILNLSDYTGPIQLRFRAVAAGGPRGDMAVDEITVSGRLLYGDMNTDNIVDASDLPGFISYWLQNDCDYDLDGDCIITLYEFSEFVRNWMDASYQ